MAFRLQCPRWVWVVVLSLSAAVLPAWAVDNSECFACHSDKSLVKTNATGQAVSLFVDEEKFAASIHHKNLCTSCHTDITEVPHAEKLKPVSCSQCHRIESQIYLSSDHGKAAHQGVTEAASCRDCHGQPHELLNYRNPSSPVNRTNVPATCAKCHSNQEKMAKYDLRQQAVTFTYEKSVHGLAHSNGVATAAVCTDCHGSHDLHRSTNPQSKLFWQTIPATCGKCHDNVRQTYARSIHGQAVAKGLRDAPACTDCHGEHTITAAKSDSSRVTSARIPETCGQCHGLERIATRYKLQSNVVETYMQSFHGLALQMGAVAAANCASCHGFHDVLPPSDPLSSVNKDNLPQTCGKCHPGIGTRLAQGEIRIHAPPGAAEGKPWLVNFITRIYIGIIIVTIGGMFAHNLLDFLKKLRAHLRAARDGDGELRFSTLMRVQHLLMMSLFITLVYTGFVHKFPDAIWSWPFRALPEGNYVRGMIHRVAGWAFAAFFVAHLVGLAGTRRGRSHLRELWVRLHDLTDAFALMAYNVGLRPTPPPHRRWNYIEKSEYWALVWGSVVMIVTGVLLIFTEIMLRLLPKVWLDVAQVIHYYEALLATLAIVVWHLYWVIFDPNEYPMNPAWLIGRKAPHSHGTTPTPTATPETRREPPADVAT